MSVSELKAQVQANMANSSQSTAKQSPAFGGWTSPIDAAMVAGGALRLSQTTFDAAGKALYFLEGRPTQGGRQVLVRCTINEDGTAHLQDVTEPSINVRSLVHEYGGGAFTLGDGLIFYCNYADQRVYAMPEQSIAAVGQPISPAQPLHFADFCVDSGRRRLLAVMEDFSAVKAGTASEPQNSIVALAYGAAAAENIAEPTTVVSGADFYAAPRLSPDGKKLAYIRWQHPNLPWDDSQLMLASLDAAGKVTAETVVAGGLDCSVFQPQWSPNGTLFYVSDQSGYWNLYAVTDLETKVDGQWKK